MAAGGMIEILVVPDASQFAGRLRNDLHGVGSTASTVGTAIGVALAAGAAVAAVGLKQVIDIGIEFQNNLNNLQAVTHATDQQMSAVSRTATALGNDLSLPATSASDAASAMLELAKGGLTVEQAMTAAKGTLQLAAAAQVDGARAAEIQANALNAFGLSADQAGHVADVLANASNAASGEITDFAQAMQSVGAVAHQFGISLDDTVTALGLFANAGIKGSDAGTLLKTALLSMAAPSKPAAAAMETLGLKAFDAQGKFVGLESIFGQLRSASQRLTPQMYDQATATVFGTDAVRLAGIAANTTGDQWDQMSDAIGRAGGAQDVAAAKMKGLGGALQGLNSQIETSELKIFDAIKGPLEQAVRFATTLVPQIGDGIASGLSVLVGIGQRVGPELASGIASGGGAVLDAARGLVAPFANVLLTGLGQAVQVGTSLFGSYVTVLGNVVTALTPVAQGIADVVSAAQQGDGILFALGATLTTLGNAAAIASGVLIPIGSVVGGLLSAFSSLPGPIQSVAIAMVALKVGGPILSSLASGFNNVRTSGTLFGSTLNAVTAPVRVLSSGVTAGVGALRQFGGEMAVQRGIAASAGQSLGVLGSAQAAFRTSTLGSVTAVRGFTDQVAAVKAGAAGAAAPIGTMGAAMTTIGERVPMLSAMGAAFTSAASGATRFGSAAGAAAAAGAGLKSLGAGLIGALGGPFGAAITGAVLALGLLASANANAQAAEAAHQATVQSLADALKASGGVFGQQAKEALAGSDQFKQAAEGLKAYGIASNDLLTAVSSGGAALDQYRARLQAVIQANTEFVTNEDGSLAPILNATGQAAADALGQLDALAGTVQQGKKTYADFAAAVSNAGGSLVNGAESGAKLKDAITTLGDAASSADQKLAALNTALDQLSGGQISLEQAQSRLNASISDIGKSFADAAQGARDAKTGLLDANGAINTTTDSGRKLLSSTVDLRKGMADAAKAAFDQAGGMQNLGPATQAATEAANAARQAFIDGAKAAGLNAQQAEELATRYGLIPSNVVTLLTAPGLDQVGQELLQLKAKFDAVPGQKTITVESLTVEAEKQLTDLGLTVERVPGSKEVKITAPTDVARGNLDAFLAFASGQIAIIKMDADPNPATGKINATVQLGNGQTSTMTLDADPNPADGKIHGVVDLGNGQTARITLDANPDPATGQITATVTYANGSKGTIVVNANDDQARAAIAALQRPTSSTHTIHVVQIWESGAPGRPGGTGLAAGGIVSAMHDGGVIGMAGGGRLSPMRGGFARMVKPNTWRIIGDRVRDDEAYIPINRSRRSQAIFEETARRMGYLVTRRYAEGGIAQARTVAAMVNARAGNAAAIVAALARLRTELASVQRQQFLITQNFNVPSAERASDKAAHGMRRLRAQGLLGQVSS